MISAKNYAAQAEKGLLQYADRLLKNGKTMGQDFSLDHYFIHELSKGIGRAMHFVLPDSGRVFNDGLRGISGELIRLPYPEITIEYYTATDNQKIDGGATIPVEKRVIYAAEIDLKLFEKAIAPIGNFFGDKAGKNAEKIAEFHKNRDNQVFIHVAAAFFTDGIWTPCMSIFRLAQDWDESSNRPVSPLKPITENQHGNKIYGGLGFLCPNLANLIAEEVGEEYMLRGAAHDITGEVSAMLELCEALSCTNVEAIIHQSANHKINSKRVKAGKLPIYETKVLTIKPNRDIRETRSTFGYERNGPRQHLRRGHIRRLSSGENTWVQSCVVGSLLKGHIDKSYEVKR